MEYFIGKLDFRKDFYMGNDIGNKNRLSFNGIRHIKMDFNMNFYIENCFYN